jgi:hypothetical protein
MISKLRFIETKHLELFVASSDLKAIAECLERKEKRFAIGINHGQKDSGDEDWYLEELSTLSVKGSGLSVKFRILDELKSQTMKP